MQSLAVQRLCRDSPLCSRLLQGDIGEVRPRLSQQPRCLLLRKEALLAEAPSFGMGGVRLLEKLPRAFGPIPDIARTEHDMDMWLGTIFRRRFMEHPEIDFVGQHHCDKIAGEL